MGFLTEPLSIIPTFGRKIGTIKVQVLTNETTNDTLTITKQPVQQGASITDHAYKEPTGYSCQILFKDNISKSLSKIYQELLDLQNGRQPFDIVTPKRLYKNMLVAVLTQTTDKATQNCLSITFSAQEVIIVPVSTVLVERRKQRNPGNTGQTQKAGKKSALATLGEGITGAFAGIAH